MITPSLRTTRRLRLGWVRLRTRAEATIERLWAPVRDVEPDFWSSLGREFSTWRLWVDRSVVLVYALATGLLVVGFTLLSQGASQWFLGMSTSEGWGPWFALVWTPALTVLVVWWTRRFVPGAAGSGIPQVIRAFEDPLDPARQSHLVSLRTSLHKIGLVSTGLLAGLSIGREGPTVQVGAGIMVHARRWLSPNSGIDAHDLMVAGAAAGIAAAFNTPLGGIVFALEQLSRRGSISHSTLVIACIVLAGLVAVAVFGNITYFGRLAVQDLHWGCSGPDWRWRSRRGWPVACSRS